MFKRLGDTGATLTLTVDGKPIRARIGDTVAAAMLAAGIEHCRTTPVSGANTPITAQRTSSRLSVCGKTQW